MAEQLPDRSEGGHPIATGLIALLTVGLVVGLVLGLVVLAGTHVLGVEGGSGSGGSTSQRSMYLPKPQRTPTPTDPQITLAPGMGGSGKHGRGHHKPSASSTPRKQLSLSGSSISAAPMELFNLTGVYPDGEGAILQVQRFEDGQWADFQATGSVINQTFQIPVQTGQVGVNRFRVVDTDTGLKSNEIKVTIG